MMKSLISRTEPAWLSEWEEKGGKKRAKKIEVTLLPCHNLFTRHDLGQWLCVPIFRPGLLFSAFYYGHS